MTYRLVYFFIPLRQPIGVPHGWRLEVYDHADWEGWESSAREAGEIRDDPPQHELSVSLLVHQSVIETEAYWQLRAASEAASRAFPSTRDLHSGSHDPLMMERDMSVVEAAVRMDSAVADDEQLSGTFDRAVAAVRVLQQAHQAVTGTPLELCTRQRLAPMVPFAVRTVEDDEAEPQWPGAISAFLTELPDAAEARVELAADELDELHTRIGRLEDKKPFRAVTIQRNAARWAAQQGLTSEAAILTAVAIEVLLGDLLALLLWEEATTPELAAATTVMPFTPKLRSEYHGRLGGNWSSTGPGPLGELNRHVFALRHRIVHAGHVATGDELRSAMESASRFESFVGDRLAASVRRYPITALQYCGTPGLDRRGALTRFVTELMADPTEPNWVETFGRWRTAVDLVLRQQDGSAVPPDVDRSVPIVVVERDLAERWWLVDRKAQVACPAETPALGDNQRASVAATTAAVASNPEIGPLSMLVLGIDAEPVQPVEWTRVGNVLPLHHVMRDLSDLRGVRPPTLIATGQDSTVTEPHASDGGRSDVGR